MKLLRHCWILVGLVTSALCFAQSQPPAPSPAGGTQAQQQLGQAEKQDTAKNNQASAPAMPAAVKPVSQQKTDEHQQATSPQNSNSPTGDSIKITDWIVAGCTFALVILAFYQWRTYHRQAGLMEKQLDEMKAAGDASSKSSEAQLKVMQDTVDQSRMSSEIGLRAYVGVGIPEVEFVPNGFVFRVPYFNYGQTPARKVQAEFGHDFVPGKDSEWPASKGIPRGKNWPNKALILTPRLDGNAPFKFTDGSGLPEKAMFASSDKGTITLYFFGRFTYEDVFGKPRFTAFCFVHNPGSKPISVHRYGSFNEAD